MSREGRKIGEGIERTVSEDPSNPERVIKRDRIGEIAERKAIARFYSGKLFHLLLPKHFPQIHRSSSVPPEMRMEKKNLDPEHLRMSQQLLPVSDRPVGYVSPSKGEREAFIVHRKQDPRIMSLKERLKEIGVEAYDQSSINFAYDEDGAAVYVDTIEPWQEEVEETHDPLRKIAHLHLNIDADRLHAAILALPNEEDRAQGEKYLLKILDLFLEERAKNERVGTLG